MDQKEFFFKQGNTKLYGSYFKPVKVRAVVVLIHGMGEYFGRYVDHVIPHFLAMEKQKENVVTTPDLKKF